MSKTVILPYDPTWEALFWAKAHCKSYITNDTVPETPANIYIRGCIKSNTFSPTSAMPRGSG